MTRVGSWKRMDRWLVYTDLASVMLDLQAFSNPIFTPPPARLVVVHEVGQTAVMETSRCKIEVQPSSSTANFHECGEATRIARRLIPKCRGARNLGARVVARPV